MMKSIKDINIKVIKEGERKHHVLSICVFVELCVWFGCLLRFPFLFLFYKTPSLHLRINLTASHSLNNTPTAWLFPVESDCGQREVFILFLLGAGTPGFSRLMHLASPPGKSK